MSYFPLGAGTGVWSFISTVTVSDDATIDITLSGTHKMFCLHIDNLVPASDARQLWLRTSVDAGSTFLSGASDYAWSNEGVTSSASTGQDGDVADSEIVLTRDFTPLLMGDGTAEALNGWVYIHNANQTVNAICITSQVGMLDSGALAGGVNGRAALIANIDEVDAIRLLASTGNLSTGRITLYGLSI